MVSKLRLFIPDPDPDFLPIPNLDPGVKKAPDPRSRIRNTVNKTVTAIVMSHIYNHG